MFLPEEEKSKAEMVETCRFAHACDLGQVTEHVPALISVFIK